MDWVTWRAVLILLELESLHVSSLSVKSKVIRQVHVMAQTQLGWDISPWCRGPDQLSLLPLDFTMQHKVFTTPLNVFMVQQWCLFILLVRANQSSQSYAYTCGGCWSFSHLLNFLPDVLMQSHSWSACVWHTSPEGLKTVSYPIQNTVITPCLLIYNFLSSSWSMQKKAAHTWTVENIISSMNCGTYGQLQAVSTLERWWAYLLQRPSHLRIMHRHILKVKLCFCK